VITYYDRAGNEISQSAAFLELTKDHERVGLDHVEIDGLTVEVSTVFLPFNHQFIPGLPPLIFETMLFVDAPDHEFDTWLDRYSTQEQAEAGHAAIVEGLRAGRWPS
jgi:hypothetical protein